MRFYFSYVFDKAQGWSMSTAIKITVAQNGEDVLRLIAQPVSQAEFGTQALNLIVSNMHHTMNERLGVGIAAPQIYVSKRVIIVASRPNLRYPDAPEMDAIVMINPHILETGVDNIWGEEGCLSVPDQRGLVLRFESVRVRYQTLTGEWIEQYFQGFPARIIQHEIDHLNGILFVDRLENSR